MKTNRLAIAAIAALALSACGGSDSKAPTKAPETSKPMPVRPKPKPGPETAVIKTEAQIKVEQQQVHQSVETAMGAIPPELREPFQKVWDCQAKANAKAGAGAVDMSGDWIVKKTAELKQNPAIANCS